MRESKLQKHILTLYSFELVSMHTPNLRVRVNSKIAKYSDKMKVSIVASAVQ